MRQQMLDFCNTKPDYEATLMRFKFEAISRYEEKLGKYCEDFSVEEIKEFYTSLQSSSYSVLAVYSTYMNGFCQFIGKEGHFKEVTSEDMNGCINVALLTSKIVTREELLHIIKDLNNAVEQAVCLCIFEGICGHGYAEIGGITADDINGNVIKLNTGRMFTISDELKHFILDACAQQKYFAYTEHEGMSEKDYLPDKKKMVKALSNSRSAHPNDPLTIRKRVYTIIYRAHNMTGSESIDSTNLRESGRLDFIRRLLTEGKSLDAALRDPNMEYRYGRIGNKKCFVDLYKDYMRED